MTTTWSGRTKPTTEYDERINYLLNEDGTYLLQESGDKIVINQLYTEYTDWTERTGV